VEGAGVYWTSHMIFEYFIPTSLMPSHKEQASRNLGMALPAGYVQGRAVTRQTKQPEL